jgi:hypothetical protein
VSHDDKSSEEWGMGPDGSAVQRVKLGQTEFPPNGSWVRYHIAYEIAEELDRRNATTYSEPAPGHGFGGTLESVGIVNPDTGYGASTGANAPASPILAHGEEGGKIVDAERPSNEQQAAGNSGPTTGVMVRSEPVVPASSVLTAEILAADPYVGYTYVAQTHAVERERATKYGKMLMRLLAARLSAHSEMQERFAPTHRHADGGLYEFVCRANYKTASDAEWSDAIIYKAEDGKVYVTTPARWQERFTFLKADEDE